MYKQDTFYIDISNSAEYIISLVIVGLNTNMYANDQLECVYDWVITEAISRITGLIISNHYNDDSYMCIYDTIGKEVEKNIINNVSRCKKLYTGGNCKMMVTYNEIIISKGVC